MVMKGCVAAYLKLKDDRELVTDYLGVGSIIGSISVLEQEVMVYGFRAISDDGAQLIQLHINSLDTLSKKMRSLENARFDKIMEI